MKQLQWGPNPAHQTEFSCRQTWGSPRTRSPWRSCPCCQRSGRSSG